MADAIADEFERALYTDSTAIVHFRTFYFDRKNPGGVENEAWAGGGWLGYQSGWLYNSVRAGAVGYTSQPIWAPDDKDGTTLLKPGQDGYTVLGQAYGQVKLMDQVFTGFRQLIDQPEVNPRDDRMTPQTVQGYSLTGKVWDIDYYGGFLNKLKLRNADVFRDFAQIAGAPAGISEDMWIGTLAYTPAPIRDLTLRVSSYLVQDILQSNYADVLYTLPPMVRDLKLQVAAQYIWQSSNGDDLLTGGSFDTWLGGALGNAVYGPYTFTAGYTQVGENANYRHPYGQNAAYNHMIVKDYDRANEKAWLLGFAYDFAALNLPGAAFSTYAAFGDGAINPTTRAQLSDVNEYDFNIDYRFTAGYWADWAKPFWIRLRAAFMEDKLHGDTDVTKDYRAIVNYEWDFK